MAGKKPLLGARQTTDGDRRARALRLAGTAGAVDQGGASFWCEASGFPAIRRNGDGWKWNPYPDAVARRGDGFLRGGEVVESKHPEFAKGELVSGVFGWQDYAVSDAKGFGGLIPPEKIPTGVDIPTGMSLFGNGLTSYFGLLDVGRPNAGDTVLVSVAAGAVGSIVCQIAKLKGCRVVGIPAGSASATGCETSSTTSISTTTSSTRE